MCPMNFFFYLKTVFKSMDQNNIGEGNKKLRKK